VGGPRPLILREEGFRAGIGVVRRGDGANIIAQARTSRAMAAITAELPVGVEVTQIRRQPHIVRSTASSSSRPPPRRWSSRWSRALSPRLAHRHRGCAVGAAGDAIVFAIMYAAGIDLHRITLGALIIALGLLVDDAIIAIEMMVVKMEQGWDRARAATFAWTSTAFPMLTGTLVTAAGFLPVGFAKSSAANMRAASSGRASR
jgi:multidrug efflux pump subunit AcrB